MAKSGSVPSHRGLLPLVSRINGALDTLVIDLAHADAEGRARPTRSLDRAHETRHLIGELSDAVADALAIIAERAESNGHPTGALEPSPLATLEALVAALKVIPQAEQDLHLALRQLAARLSSQQGVLFQVEILESWPAKLPAGVGLGVYRLIEEVVLTAFMQTGIADARVVLSGDPGSAQVIVEEIYSGSPGRILSGRLTRIRARAQPLEADLHTNIAVTARIWTVVIPISDRL